MAPLTPEVESLESEEADSEQIIAAKGDLSKSEESDENANGSWVETREEKDWLYSSETKP